MGCSMTKKGLWLGGFFLFSLSVLADGNMGELAFDEQGLTPGTAVPTITAEGDFLLPTYMLPAGSELLISTHALNGSRKSVRLVSEEQESLKATAPQPEKRKISLMTVEEGTQIQAKKLGTGHKSTDITLQREILPREDERTLAPAPEPDMQVSDLIRKQQMFGQQGFMLRDGGVTPPVAAPANSGQQERTVLAQKPNLSAPVVKQEPKEMPVPHPPVQTETQTLTRTETISRTAKGKEQRPLLIPMGKEPPAENEGVTEEEILPPVRYVVPSRYADQMLSTAGRRQISSSFVMPKEIKVSFYQNAFSLSGQAMKWMKAFSLGAIQDPRLMIDVRISTENRPLQEKRLRLIEQVLLQNGLSRHQLRVTWTQRNAHSVMLRYIDRADEDEVIVKRTAKSEKK